MGNPEMISVKLKNCLGTTGKYLWRSAAYEKSWDEVERDCRCDADLENDGEEPVTGCKKKTERIHGYTK